MDDDSIFPTPEAAGLAALADCPVAEAKVVRLEYDGTDNPIVFVDTVRSYPETNCCARRGAGGWALLAAFD